jgi:hypothetical protein
VLLLAVAINRQPAFSVFILSKAFKKLVIVIPFVLVSILLISSKNAIKSGSIVSYIFIRSISSRVISLILKSYIKKLYSRAIS